MTDSHKTQLFISIVGLMFLHFVPLGLSVEGPKVLRYIFVFFPQTPLLPVSNDRALIALVHFYKRFYINSELPSCEVKKFLQGPKKDLLIFFIDYGTWDLHPNTDCSFEYIDRTPPHPSKSNFLGQNYLKM